MCFLITWKLIKGSFGDVDWKPPNLQLRPDFTTVSKGMNCRSAPAQDEASVPVGTSSDGTKQGTVGSRTALPTEREARAQPAWKYSWAQDPPCAAALSGLLCFYTSIWAQLDGNKFLLLNWICFLTEKRSIKRPKKGLFRRSSRYQSVLLLAHPQEGLLSYRLTPGLPSSHHLKGMFQ